jgi:hypothetical protein
MVSVNILPNMNLRHYRCEVFVRGDEIALLNLLGLRVLEADPSTLNSLAKSNSSHLVVSWPYHSIVAEVSINISGNDFSVDTISRKEILVGRFLPFCAGNSCSLSRPEKHYYKLKRKNRKTLKGCNQASYNGSDASSRRSDA